MRNRNLIAIAAGGLALLVLAVLLCTGRLPHFTVDMPGINPTSPGNVLSAVSDPDELAAGGLFVLRPGADTPTDWRATLESHSITIGSPTGDGAYIVRVPEGAALAPEALPGASLRAYGPKERLSGDLRALLGVSAAEDGVEIVTVSLFDPADKQAVAALVQRLGGSILRGQNEVDAAALRVSLPTAGLAPLAAAPEAVYIESYTAPEMLNDRATAVAGITPLTIPGFTGRAGLTGAGQIVALADSGLDTGRLDDLHPDLRSEPGEMPKVPYLHSRSGGGTADTIGHGTHMAATIAGTGAVSGGKYRGAAPGSSIYFQALMNKAGQLEPPPDLTTLFRPARDAGARIHVNGWGGPINAYRSAPAQIDRFVRDNPDFLPIFGAGNTGPNAKTLTTEANSKNALVVGAAVSPRPAYATDSGAAGETASFSSRGPTADGRIKPDLIVPGTAVISVRSRVGPPGMTGNPDYIRMQGTSQAAAVAGGAAAILREYFIKEEKRTDVPAALLKAALVNGARPSKSVSGDAGFGLLDLTATVLALRTESFHYRDHRKGLTEGEDVSYKYELQAPGTTFRATLAWTDPAARPGATDTLVNDLDLLVRAPDGAIYPGNQGGAVRTRDNTNNVERVTIENAVPGTYTVTVRAHSVSATAVRDSFAAAQDFALVYGAPPVRGVVVGHREETLELADGEYLPVPPGSKIHSAVDDRPVSNGPIRGADLYYFPDTTAPALFSFAHTRQIPGITTLSVGGQTVFTALDHRQRDGGYLLNPRAALYINGVRSNRPVTIPPGADLTAVVNPSTQSLWRADLQFNEQWGILAAVDAQAATLRLFGDDADRPAAQAVVAATDRIVDGGWADIPFGAAAPAGLGRLLPGTSVYLVQSPHDDSIRYIEARRLITTGMIQEIGAEGVTLETGKQYRIFPGASVKRDGVESTIGDLGPGDHISAVLMADSRALLSIDAHSRVRYGQVVYLSGQGSSLYLLDTDNRFRTLRLAPDTMVFRWGLPVDTSALAPGQWVRLTLDPQNETLWRIDIAEVAEKGAGVITAYHPYEFQLRLADGREYQFSPRALITKNGHPVWSTDLRVGEAVEFTALAAPDPTGAVLTSVAARTGEGVATPELTVSALPLSEQLFVSGRTTADRVRLHRADGSRRSITPKNGAFSILVERLPGEDVLRVVALNTKDGGVNGADVQVREAEAAPAPRFTDLAGCWAGADIEALAGRGLLSGYPDGSFRPDNPVSRAEFTAILVRVLGWPTPTPAQLPFTDRDRIPAWVAPSVAAAAQRDLVRGYADGTFQPQGRITRAEAATLLVRALADFTDTPDDPDLTPPPFADWASVPTWARSPVTRAWELGLFRGRQHQLFAPQAPLTRAETAAIINRYLSSIAAP